MSESVLLRAFLCLAIVASSGPIPLGGNASVKMVHGNNPTPKNLNETYHRAFRAFFEDFTLQMNKHFPNESGKVNFFFDENRNEGWLSILETEIKAGRVKDSRIGSFTTVVDTDEDGIPCQVADLFAYVNRQNNETVYEMQLYVPQRILDIVVSRQGYPEWHPFSALKKMGDKQWVELITELRGRKKQFDLRNELLGTKPKPQYYPIIEHPYFKYLYRLCDDHKKKHPELWV